MRLIERCSLKDPSRSAGVGGGAEVANDEMVHGAGIEVREELRGLVAEGEASGAMEWSEESVAGEVVERLGWLVARVDDECDEVVGVWTVDCGGEHDKGCKCSGSRPGSSTSCPLEKMEEPEVCPPPDFLVHTEKYSLTL